ncbi:chromatin modification- protein VID21 [Arachnomyces sp. PD_36]|nr:chromatin modification- protein VID21 [Arachnomyces sp. PD_36]
MLRDELLQSKNDEIARCLLSRKRKLSELYFATVGFACGATEHSQTAFYQQKEKAFLDANDLTKGRYYNEATLPPRPDIATARSTDIHDSRSNGGLETGKEKAGDAQGKEIATDTVAPTVVASSSPPEQPTSIVKDASAPIQNAPSDKDQTDEVKATILPPHTSADNSRAATPPARPADGLEIERPSRPPPIEPTRPPEGSTEPLGEKASVTLARSGQPSPAPSRVSQQTMQEQQADGTPKLLGPSYSPSKRTKYERPPSMAINTGSHITERPLSSASSGGPFSNITAISGIESPNTTPGKEDLNTPIGTALPSKLPEHISPAIATPEPSTRIPSTPDEQLKLEEAQSFQNISDANQSLGDDARATGLPSSNEVLEDTTQAVKEGGSEKTREDIPMTESHVEPEGQPKGPSTDATIRPSDAEGVSGSMPSQETPSDSATVPTLTSSVKKPLSTTSTQSQRERMTTRVSSGAIRHKSVSEILGEVPKPSSQLDRASTEPHRDISEKDDSPVRLRLKDRKDREKERSKMSTVVFPKQADKNRLLDLMAQNTGDNTAALNQEKDYLYTLFQAKAYYPPRSMQLNSLLSTAHKTLTTSNHFVEYQEQMDCRTLKRIYQLQHANRWPLRQIQRSVEPPRQGSHWDVLLDHMKWMRTDFREERKWKIAAAKSCADWCAEYVSSDAENKALLRVPTKRRSAPLQLSPPDSHTENAQVSESSAKPGQSDENQPLSHPTPELVPSTEYDSVSEGFNDDPQPDIHDTVAPAAIFSLSSDEFTFQMDRTPAAGKLLDELPLYEPLKVAPDTDLPCFKTLPDASWRTDILPVSKYATGKIKFRSGKPPRKRSRYDYADNSSNNDSDSTDIPPEQVNVALFRPENNTIRERVHPSNPFRPPTEFPMPPLSFFESRQSSQWTYAEDDELRQLVKEYPYNWSLISSCTSPKSNFSSGAERRTPWECFERWISLEGLPADMSKTPYFRAYHARLEAAQRTLLAQQAAQQQQQQQQGNNGTPQGSMRRRTSQPVRVDRRRNSRHLALLDAMRKLSKKRETTLQKQQHATHLATLRKANEVNQPRPPLSTPAEFSRLKHEREVKFQERQEQYRQQMIAHQRANLAHRTGQQPNQQPPLANGTPARNPNGMPPSSASPGNSGSLPTGLPNGLPTNNNSQPRPHPTMQNLPNGGPVNGQMPPGSMTMKMVPQAGLQQQMNGRVGMPSQTSPDNARVIREANRVQEQQRLLQSRQQQHQFPGQQTYSQPGSHTSPNLANVNPAPSNPAMVNAMQSTNGMGSPSFQGPSLAQNVSSASPRMGQPNPLSSGVVPTISNLQSSIQRNNPNMSSEQVNKLATERLHQYQQHQQQRMSQVAMNAAAGNIGAVSNNYQVPHDVNMQQQQQHPPSQAGMSNGSPPVQNSQIQGYSPMMRVSQPGPPNRVGVGSPAVNGTMSQPSRSATPQNQRSGSAQLNTAPGSSKSPRAPPVQMANG